MVKINFNTTLVKVHLAATDLAEAEYNDFNTTLVKVHHQFRNF